MKNYNNMENYNIKIFGVGGGGSNTVDYIVDSGTLDFVKTYAVNTDAQALDNSKANKKIHIGQILTKGLGAGAIPTVGKKAAEESIEELVNELRGTDIVFIASGMGGGTGTGAAPYVAEISRKLGILTIGVVTKPFDFEGPSRMKMALEGIKELEKSTDVTIVIPNEKLIQNYNEMYIEEAFVLPDEVLRKAIETIVRMLDASSNVSLHIDLNTLRSTLKDQGLAVMGVGESNEKDLTIMENLIKALENAIDSNILEISVYGSKKIVLLIGGNINFITAAEEEEIINYLKGILDYEYQIIIGYKDESDKDETYRSVTIIATGYDDPKLLNQITSNEKKNYDSNLFLGL